MGLYHYENTLDHYMGKVWLTKPIDFSNSKDKFQHINVCIKSDDDSIAADYLRLEPDGTYYKKEKSVGKIDSLSFNEYIERTFGVGITQDGADLQVDHEDPFESVCAIYKHTNSIGATSRTCGMAEKRVRRILITNDLYTSDTYKKVKGLKPTPLEPVF